MYCRLIDGSLVTLSKAKYARTDPQILSTSHVPLTNINGAIPLGLDWQTWTISGVIADSMSVRWHDIVWLSLDNIAWRACRVQTTAFPTNNYQQSTYELTVLVSPILEGAAVRYPTTGYKFGLQSITGISQAGNVSAFPTIHYLAPLFYAPLSNTLIDFTGAAVTFTRTASKVHAGVTYPINTPIFDSGLYIGSDTALDFAMWTPPVSTLKTIAMQIKSWVFPGPWVIGGSGGNGLTANQSNAGTDTTGMAATAGTLTRSANNLITGTGDFKVVATGGNLQPYITTKVAISAGLWVAFQVVVGCVGMAGRQVQPVIQWFNAGGGLITSTFGTLIACPTTARLLLVMAQAPSGTASASVYVNVPSAVAGQILYITHLMLSARQSVSTVWTATHNKLTIDFANNLIKWTDDSATISLALPAAYLTGTVMDVVLFDDTSHVVTLVAHPAGGSWTSATGTLAALTWPQLTLGSLEGSIANLIEYGYVLTGAESQAIVYFSLSLLFNSLYIGNRYAGEVIKGSDKRLVNANGSDISALLGGVDIPIGSAAVTIAQSQGLSARWYVEVKRTDV